MIVDIIKNLETYKGLSDDIYISLKFLNQAKPDIEIGEYTINENVKAIVSEYETVEDFELGYEAHKHAIDIQFPIRGLERVKWSPIKEMDVHIPYDVTKDRTLFINPSKQATHVDIGNGIFTIMFPDDGHSPQHYISRPEFIKKITIKISI